MLILFLLLFLYLCFSKEGFKNNEDLDICSTDPMTGYTRNGTCNLIQGDQGTHTVCAEVTDEFLDFSLNRGNDLITPNQRHDFPGLNRGDNWCLCALRWKEAYECAEDPSCDDIEREHIPKIIEDSTHIRTFELVPDLSDPEIRERYIKDINLVCNIRNV